MSTTELFTRDGKLHSILTETVGLDGIVTQEWRFSPNARAFEGAEAGSTEINVRLADADRTGYQPRAADIEKLMAAWRSAIARPGFRDAGRGGEDGAHAFLVQTRGRGVLHATTRA